MEVGAEGDYIPIATLSPPRNDSCNKMGSDESHFNVSAGSDRHSHKTSAYQPNALPLGQTGSHRSQSLTSVTKPDHAPIYIHRSMA